MLTTRWRSTRNSLPFLALVLLCATVAGCQPDRCKAPLALPADNPDDVPVEVPETTIRWQGEMAGEVRFVVVTGMNRFAFLAASLKDLAFKDRELGFPGLVTILEHEPDFFVATGDSVYYDTPFIGRAESQEEMRAKWHRQFSTPRFAALYQRVPTYWEKDDHDFRYEDADPYGPFEPSSQLGAEVFLEQVPVADPSVVHPLTYRTYRVNDLLQIWLLEGRDHRDPNTEPPGPDKTLWGEEQRAWLNETLLASDATFKILISPTPMVGPDDTHKGVQGGFLAPYFGGKPLGQGDDNTKRDNHLNTYGFKDEGDAFFDWLEENGFLEVTVYPPQGEEPAVVEFSFYDEHGTLLYQASKTSPQSGERRVLTGGSQCSYITMKTQT